MKWREQGTERTDLYTVVPRTLVFVTRGDQVLLQQGAASKRLWAQKLNGIGGHLKPGEDIVEGARREVMEECGLALDVLALRGIVHISGQAGAPGVMLCVFHGISYRGDVRASKEGVLAWYPLSALPTNELVADLPYLLPHVLATDTGIFSGLYATDTEGQISWYLRP